MSFPQGEELKVFELKVFEQKVFRAKYEKRAKSGATGPIVGGTCWKKIGRKSRQKLCKKGTIGISSKVSPHTLIGEINPTDCQGWLDGA